MSVSREKFLDKADNSIYKLVILAAKRATEIQAGQPVLKHQASQMVKEDMPASDSQSKMDATFTASGMVDDNEEEEISTGHQEIHSPPKDDYQGNGKG